MPDSQQTEKPDNTQSANPAMDEAQEEQQRGWRDEAGETFVNLLFAREGMMQARVQRQQSFEERLREQALTGQWPAGDKQAMGGVSVGNKVFNFHGDSSASQAMHAGQVDANPPEPTQAKSPIEPEQEAETATQPKSGKLRGALGMLLPLAMGTALGLGVPALLDFAAGEAGRPRPAVSVRTALKLPDGTVVPIRPELFDSTQFYPER